MGGSSRSPGTRMISLGTRGRWDRSHGTRGCARAGRPGKILEIVDAFSLKRERFLSCERSKKHVIFRRLRRATHNIPKGMSMVCM